MKITIRRRHGSIEQVFKSQAAYFLITYPGEGSTHRTTPTIIGPFIPAKRKRIPQPDRSQGFTYIRVRCFQNKHRRNIAATKRKITHHTYQYRLYTPGMGL